MNTGAMLAFVAANTLVLGGAGLMVNQCGHLTFSIAAAWGVSAYCFAAATLASGSLVLGAAAGVLGGVACCLLQWALSIRLKKLALALATLPMQEILMAAMASMPWFGGRMGIVGFQRLPLDRWPAVSVILVAIGVALPWAIGRSRFGKRLTAARLDQLAAESVGMRPSSLWLGAYLVAGLLIGLGGVSWAAYVGAVAYNSFELHLSILLLLAAIIGRRAGFLGPVIGALFLVLLPELLRSLPMPMPNPDFARNILFAVVAVVILAWRANRPRPVQDARGGQ